MTITNQQEYKTKADETISIQFNVERNIWEVAAWDKNDQSRWYREFFDKADALKEFERWKL